MLFTIINKEGLFLAHTSFYYPKREIKWLSIEEAIKNHEYNTIKDVNVLKPEICEFNGKFSGRTINFHYEIESILESLEKQFPFEVIPSPLREYKVVDGELLRVDKVDRSVQFDSYFHVDGCFY